MVGKSGSTLVLVAGVFAALVTSARAADLYVVDGDTIIVGDERIRLTSEDGPVDAPEIHREGSGYSPARCAGELERAAAARARLAALLASGDWSVDRREVDSRGRTVAVIYAEGEDVAAKLVRDSHARPWPRPFFRNKPNWCAPAP